MANGTLNARDPLIWGEGTTACASDSKQFGAWDQNLMTEWHIRYGGRGVMIYWHVERKSLCIHSQLKSPSSSEVASDDRGRHAPLHRDGGGPPVRGQPRAGVVAFAFCQLLGFQLLPRLKRSTRSSCIGRRPASPTPTRNLQPVLSRPIDWELIRRQYDEMVKYATALRLGTAEAEAILRRFTRENVQHPTYKALAELGKARENDLPLPLLAHRGAAARDPRRAERGRELEQRQRLHLLRPPAASSPATGREDQELSMLGLHLLQNCMVYVNTLMIQQVLTRPEWKGRLTPRDLHALTPLFWGHVNPYGRFDLDMRTRLDLN